MLPLQISFRLYPLCQQVLVKQLLNGFNCLPTLHFCLMSNLVIHPTIKGQALSLLITKIGGKFLQEGLPEAAPISIPNSTPFNL